MRLSSTAATRIRQIHDKTTINDAEKERLLDHLLIKQLLDGLEERERSLIDMRYFQNKTQTELLGGGLLACPPASMAWSAPSCPRNHQQHSTSQVQLLNRKEKEKLNFEKESLQVCCVPWTWADMG